MPSSAAEGRPSSISRGRVADLRKLVDDARAGGVDLAKMELQVSQRDESIMKRSADVATSELSFANGEIRFLGVKVVRSTTARSVLAKASAA